MNFQPREVPRRSVHDWFVEALKLTRRKVLEFIGLALVPIVLAKVDGSGLLVQATFPLLLVCGCVVAKSADYSQSTLQSFRDIGSRSWIRVFIAGSALPVIFASLTLLTGNVDLSEIAPDDPFSGQTGAGSTTAFLITLSTMLAMVAIAIGIMLRMTRFLWFFWTLCLLPGMPAVEAFDQSCEATEINGFVIWPYATFFLLLLVTVLLPALFIPWFAIATSMMYVSYRDIWLNQTQNEPEKSSEAVISQAT